MDNDIDIASDAWAKFFEQRTKPQRERFPGYYRALVVETNDPLNMRRVRFKCPELHDFDLDPGDCPWAVPANDMGGFRAGRFAHPVIGDWVWITFEKQHPYGPVWVGFADPTRRKRYPYQSVYTVSPIPVDSEGGALQRPEDYDDEYLPRDGRPMSHGWVDRYGNAELCSSVGFFPKEHDKEPPPPDHDAVQGQEFEQLSNKPEVNKPDLKYMARVTKYGNIFMMSDKGYHWRDDGDVGEFKGDFAEDEEFESKRWLYIQKLLNEGKPDDSDQRKQCLLTRYGHLIEMRDTGWAQAGPIESKSRDNEYGEPKRLSDEYEHDYRWIKIRTKGGMLFQAYDKGFHPQDDKFIKRSLLSESGTGSEHEDKYWGDRDARWMRCVTRHGIKFVLDDRGSHETDARGKEYPRGIGLLIKGRRTPASKNMRKVGDPRGFYIEFNERDDANHLSIGSPLGQAFEINDRYQYIMLAASLGRGWSRKWMHVKDNEFLCKPSMLRDPERNSHHLKIDHDNEYIRLKTRAGSGTAPDNPSNKSALHGDTNQGFEARDGRKGDGPWVELVDAFGRGIWMCDRYNMCIIRGKRNNGMYQWFHDDSNKIVIYCKDVKMGTVVGTVEINVGETINIISDKDVHIQAAEKIYLRSDQDTHLQAGSTMMTWRHDRPIIETNARIKAKEFITSPHGDPVDKIDPTPLPYKLEPTDRGKTYHKPYEEAEIE